MFIRFDVGLVVAMRQLSLFLFRLLDDMRRVYNRKNKDRKRLKRSVLSSETYQLSCIVVFVVVGLLSIVISTKMIEKRSSAGIDLKF